MGVHAHHTMFGIGPLELVVILLIALVVVGPQRLPEVGRTLGKAMREFRKAQDELKGAINFDFDSDPEPPRPAPHRPRPSTAAVTPAPVSEETPADALERIEAADRAADDGAPVEVQDAIGSDAPDPE